MRCLFVLILRRAFFSPLAAKLIGLQTGCQFFKKMLIFPTPTPLRVWVGIVHIYLDFFIFLMVL